MEKDNLKLKIVLVFNFPMKIKSLEVSNTYLFRYQQARLFKSKYKKKKYKKRNMDNKK